MRVEYTHKNEEVTFQMSRNLQDRLKKLSRDLIDLRHEYDHDDGHLTEEELAELQDEIDDVQDEIWDIEHIMAGDGEFDYTGKPTKDWT